LGNIEAKDDPNFYAELSRMRHQSYQKSVVSDNSRIRHRSYQTLVYQTVVVSNISRIRQDISNSSRIKY